MTKEPVSQLEFWADVAHHILEFAAVSFFVVGMMFVLGAFAG